MPFADAVEAREGAYRLHTLYNPLETTGAARRKAAFNLDGRLLAELKERVANWDTLPEQEQMRRLYYARKAHFQRMAIDREKAKKARRQDAGK